MKKDTPQKVARPFLKWVGGKAKLMPQLLPLIPDSYHDYYEPFLGGGAFYFALPNVGNAYLNDINQHLIASYVHVREDIEEIVAELKVVHNTFHSLLEEEQKEYYLARRTEYNELNDSNIRKTSLLIFLNKTCFNGIYRENRKGYFNVPFNRSKNPPILDEPNLRLVSTKIANAKFSSGSYTELVKSAKKGDFIYFDPPYHPLNATSSFTSYHADNFSAADQEELRDTFTELDKRGCYVMLSNSASEFIQELYKDFRQEELLAARSINSVGAARGKIKELVILNY